MRDVLDAFLKYLSLEKNYSPLTIRAYQTDLLQFIEFLVESRHKPNPPSVDRVTKEDLRLFLSGLIRHGLSI